MSQHPIARQVGQDTAPPSSSQNANASARGRTSTHTSGLRIPQSNFARSFSRPLPPPSAANTLKPPFAFDANRGSVTSIYSQASTAERPASAASASFGRKQQTRTGHDLTAVDEEASLITPRYHSPTSNEAHNAYGQPSIVTPRRNSIEQDDRPLVSPITRTNSQWSRSAVSPEQSVRNTKISRSDTIAALSKAISSTIHSPTRTTADVTSDSYNGPRMPFEGSPESVSSQDETKTLDGRDDPDRMAAIPLYESRNAAEYLSARGQSPTDTRSMSMRSTNPLLESPLEQSASSMSDRIPAHKRPPNLNLNLVKESESRGSLTSLPDLIQRATRLASNLDRGKTASRLGLDAMFFNSEKSSIKKRTSTYSDVLFSFPAPAARTPTPSGNEQRSNTKDADGKEAARSNSRLMDLKGTDEEVDDDGDNEKAQGAHAMRSKRRRRRTKKRRQCCGLPVKVFVVLLILFILLVAAAVLLPIFLIWLPKRNAAQNTSSGCSTTMKCQNGGVSVIENNTCACVCVDGFRGNTCTVSGGSSCITATIRDGDMTYENATVGSNILPVLSNAPASFNIPLNKTSLLSLFSRNNLSCSEENAFVRFTADTLISKRLIMIPGHEPHILASLPLPDKVVAGNPAKRQTEAPPAATENNIVFAATTTSSAAPVETSAAIATATPTTTSGAPSATPSVKVTSAQINFAQLVVLYVLQQLRDPSIAVNTTQTLDQYLKSGALNNGTDTVNVVPYANSKIIANFQKFTVTNIDGSVVGGKAGDA